MNVLFVSGYELESPNANSMCLCKIIDEMKNYGDLSVDIIGDSIFENEELSWKSSPIVFSKRIIHWPAVQPDAIKTCVKKIAFLNLDIYDFIIVPHKPYEVVAAILKLKDKINKAKIYLYELDPMTNEIDKINGIGRHLFIISRFKEQLMYSKVDHIFHMECNRDKYSGKEYRRYSCKSSYLDFPMLTVKPSSMTSSRESDNTIRLLYSGGLDRTYRNPSYALSILDALSQHDANNTYVYQFFSKGNCEDDIAEIAQRNHSFVQYGYVNQDILMEYYGNADFLINISNQYSDMVPSKMFAYISQCKPIIHFTNNRRDGCIPYLNRYNLSLILDENDSFEDNVQKVIIFVNENVRKTIDYNKIRKIFIKNTAKWSAEQILEQMKKDCSNGV